MHSTLELWHRNVSERFTYMLLRPVGDKDFHLCENEWWQRCHSTITTIAVDYIDIELVVRPLYLPASPEVCALSVR